MALKPDPDNFSYYSGYESFKQYIGTFTGTLAVSGVVPDLPPNNWVSFSLTVALPAVLPTVELYMSSNTVNPGRKWLVENLQIENLVRSGSSNYNLEINVATTGSTVIMDCAVNNPTGTPLTLVTEDLLFEAKAFVSPFN